MPDHGTVLTHVYPTGGKIGVGIIDGDLATAYDSLCGVIVESAADRSDPTQGLWYCEKVQR